MQGSLGLLLMALMGADDAPVSPPSPIPRTGIFSPQTTGDEPRQEEIWQLSLPEALRISLNHSAVVRPIVCSGTVPIRCEGDGQDPVQVTVEGRLADDTWYGKTPLIVAWVHADAQPLRAKGAVTAHLRSVEQQYWSLIEAHTRLWAIERAVELAEEVLKCEEADLYNTPADLAGCRERVEQFRLDFVAKMADTSATERRLRGLMGLPASERRKIIPITPHVKEQRSFPQQVLVEATPSMARAFLEIDASFQRLQAALQHRETSLKQVDAERERYDEGFIIADRYFDAVSRYASAVVEECRLKTAYNVALARGEEARGTYLSAHNIFVAVGPTRVDPRAPIGGAEPSVKASGGGVRAN